MQESHGLEQGSTCSEHVVGKECDLTLHVSEQLYALDVGVLRVLGHDGIIPFLVNHGEGLLESSGIEFVAVNGTCVRAHDDQIFLGQINHAGKLPDYLIGCVQVLTMRVAECVRNLP